MNDSDSLITEVSHLITSFRFLTSWPVVTGKQYLKYVPFPIWQAVSVVAESESSIPCAGGASAWRNVFQACVTNFTMTHQDRLQSDIATLLPQFRFSGSQVRNLERGVNSTIGLITFGDVFRQVCRSQVPYDRSIVPLFVPKSQRVIYACRFRIGDTSYRYVGQSHKTIGRYESHFSRAQEAWWSGKGTYFHEQLAKLPGVINFKRPFFGTTTLGPAVAAFGMGDVLKCFRVLERCDAEEADDRERYWIEKLDSKNRATGGCNSTAGGGVKGRNKHLYPRRCDE